MEMAEKHPRFEYHEEQDVTGYKAYLCGTSAMVKRVHKTVTANGMKPEDFFYERK